MKLKILNLFLASGLILFSVVYGIVNYNNNLRLADEDNLYQLQVLSELNSITKSIADDINITNANKANNNRTSTSNSPATDVTAVNFKNFKEMYTYAVQKYNKASYVYTLGEGTVWISGSALGYNIVNKPVTLKAIKAKELNERYFYYALNGQLVDGLNPLNLVIQQYSNGITATSLKPDGITVTSIPMSAFTSNTNWNMTQIFHLPTEDVANALTENEYSFFYSESSKEYYATVNFNVNGFDSNFGHIFKYITDANALPSFANITMEIVVDNYGNFKRIKFVEEFTTAFKYKDITMNNGRVKTEYTESFIIIDNGYVPVTNPFEQSE